jgi:hypothetical protein
MACAATRNQYLLNVNTLCLRKPTRGGSMFSIQLRTYSRNSSIGTGMVRIELVVGTQNCVYTRADSGMVGKD